MLPDVAWRVEREELWQCVDMLQSRVGEHHPTLREFYRMACRYPVAPPSTDAERERWAETATAIRGMWRDESFGEPWWQRLPRDISRRVA